MTTLSRHSALIVGLLLLGGTACASTPEASPSTKGDDTRTSRDSESTDVPPFGDDPMGAARQWLETHREAEDAPERLETFDRPVVARLYRHRDGRFRALVTDQNASRRSKAVLLTLEPDDSRRWTVVDVQHAEATHLWPEM